MSSAIGTVSCGGCDKVCQSGTECSAAEGFYGLTADDINGQHASSLCCHTCSVTKLLKSAPCFQKHPRNPVPFAGLQGRAVLVANVASR